MLSRREALDATPADTRDEAVLLTDAIIHIASETAGPVAEFCREAAGLLGQSATVTALTGVVRAANHTGAAIHNFPYAHQAQQQRGAIMPNTFLNPLRKTAAWWAKDCGTSHLFPASL